MRMGFSFEVSILPTGARAAQSACLRRYTGSGRRAVFFTSSITA
jgi:hypothetical protein